MYERNDEASGRSMLPTRLSRQRGAQLQPPAQWKASIEGHHAVTSSYLAHEHLMDDSEVDLDNRFKSPKYRIVLIRNMLGYCVQGHGCLRVAVNAS
jgi:hypothetical protein